MLLFALACVDPTVGAPLPDAERQEIWLTAQPDELFVRADGDHGRQLVYEDVVQLPDDTLTARLFASTTLEGDACGRVDVFVGARSEDLSSQTRSTWPGHPRFAIQHPLDPTLLGDPLELFVASRAPGDCIGPQLDVSGLALVITRGARR